MVLLDFMNFEASQSRTGRKHPQSRAHNENTRFTKAAKFLFNETVHRKSALECAISHPLHCWYVPLGPGLRFLLFAVPVFSKTPAFDGKWMKFLKTHVKAPDRPAGLSHE